MGIKRSVLMWRYAYCTLFHLLDLDAAPCLKTPWHRPTIFYVGAMSFASDVEFLPFGFHVGINALYCAYTWQLWCLGIAGFFVTLVWYLLAVPSDLRHLPRVSPYATIWSYARRESVDRRVKRLILPFAERGEGVVSVYMLGKWGVHVLDANVCLLPLVSRSLFLITYPLK